MESVLITGASGFIGSFIVEEALKRRFGVWAGIRSTSSKKYLKNRKIHFLELDFAHPNELRAQLSGHKGTYNKLIISFIVPVSPNVLTKRLLIMSIISRLNIL